MIGKSVLFLLRSELVEIDLLVQLERRVSQKQGMDRVVMKGQPCNLIENLSHSSISLEPPSFPFSC